MKRSADFMDDQDLQPTEKAARSQREFAKVLDIVFPQRESSDLNQLERFYNHALPLGCSEFNSDEQRTDPDTLALQLFRTALITGYEFFVEDFCRHNDTIKKYIHIRFNGWSWLHYAAAKCSERAIRALVAAGVNLNEPTNLGESPIFIAVRHNNLPALRALSALGCVDAPAPYSGLTAAGLIKRRIAACQSPQILNTEEELSDMASEELEEELPDNSSEESSDAPHENIETLKAMLDYLTHQHDEKYLPLQSCLTLATNSSLDTMLHNVCKSLDIKTLEHWIQHHQDGHIIVNFNQPNVDGTTPLMQAVIAERYTYNVPRDDDSKVKIRNFIIRLVNAGANINAQDRYQRDALFLALCEGCFTSYNALLECGADPIASHTFRRAFYSKRVDYLDIVSALKIFIQHKDPTPLTLGKLIHTLVSLLHDAEPINENTDESQFLDGIIRRLSKHTHSIHTFRPETKPLKPHDLIEAISAQGETPIFTAIKLGKVDFVRYFLSKNCNLLTTNDPDETVWDVANQMGNPTIINLLSLAKQKFSTLEGIKEYFDSFGCHQPAVNVLYRLKLLDENLDGNLRALFWKNGIKTPDQPSNITFSFTPKEPDSECVSEQSYSEDEQEDSAEGLSDDEENQYRFE